MTDFELMGAALEEARNEKIIGKSQEASLTVTAPAALVAPAGSFDPSVFEELFIVASVQFVEGDGDEITAAVTVAEGEKCPPCWTIRELGGNPDHPDVCERCGDALDAIEAVLPAGTLSGAPKLRACQLIAELENNKRGIYGGAIGYIDFTGNMDTCIAIRIAYQKNGRVFVRSGAGIVADSVPEQEFEECMNKARASLRALELAQEAEL